MKSNLLLLITAAIWGFAFVAQRAGMEFTGPFAFNAARFALGSISLIPLIIINQRRTFKSQKIIPSFITKTILLGGTAAGIILFFGSSFQQTGIVYTTAGKAGFITGLYIILVPILGLFFFQKTSIGTWAGAVVAVIGLYLLSFTSKFTIASGDLLVLISAFFWSAHVLLIGRISPKTDPIKLAFFQFVICSLLSFIAALIFETTSINNLTDGLIPILYAGLMSVGIAYTLQIVAQRDAHPSHAAIIMSLEAVFAVIGGWIILDEIIPLRGLIGSGLMLLGMIISQMNIRKFSLSSR